MAKKLGLIVAIMLLLITTMSMEGVCGLRRFSQSVQPDEPPAATDHVVPDEPPAATDHVVPDEPPAATDDHVDVVPEEPPAATDDVVPDEPPAATDGVVPDKPPATIDHVAACEPSAAAIDQNVAAVPPPTTGIEF